MTYQVKGTLKLPDGSPAANCEIEFVSRKNLSPTVQGSKTNIKTSGTGYYDVTLELGEYAVIIYAGGTYPVQAGVIVVLADTVTGQDLPTLLSNGELLPTTPDYMQQIQAWLVAANEAADDSAASSAASEASAQAAAASAATTAAAVTAHEAKPSAHPISGVGGLQAALDSKEVSGAAASAVAAHKIEAAAHGIDNIDGLREALISAGGGGGGGGGGFGGQYKKLSIIVSGTGYQGTITAERLVVESAYFVSKTLRDVSVSFNGANAGANGIDSGSIVPGNWYYIYVIHNSNANSTASLISLSATQPSLPTGFTDFALVGCARVQSATTSFVASVQNGRIVRYGTASAAGSIQIVSSSTITDVTIVSTLVAVPPCATGVKLVVSGDTSGATAVYDSVGIHAINRFGGQNYPYSLDIESIDNTSIKYQVSNGSAPTNIYVIGYYL